jgi:N-acetylmuramic acid 6-phosphate etherase
MLESLITESSNPDSADIDRLSTQQMLGVMHQADRTICDAVQAEIPRIAAAVDRIAALLDAGGRLFYTGAGTSGRLGVLDASECPPTYQCPPEMVQGIIAGGDVALRHSVERAEDSPEQGKADLVARHLTDTDAVVGIAASGRTPYVVGALEYARGLGAFTIALSCVPDPKIGDVAELSIAVVTGPEVITGSTRMRAGTATKLVLNMISTGVMVRLGYVYGNLMVNVEPTNSKLEDRARRIIVQATGASYEEAAASLKEAGSVRAAIVMKKLGVSREEAMLRVERAKGRLRVALGENKA